MAEPSPPSTSSGSSRPSSRRDFETEEEYRAFRDLNNLATRRSREKRAEKERLAREESTRLQDENQGLQDENQGLQEENQGLQDENKGLREGNQELQERVQNLIDRLGENEKVTTELREKLQILQRTSNEAEERARLADAEKLAADEEIHTLIERVAELEATYLGGYRD